MSSDNDIELTIPNIKDLMYLLSLPVREINNIYDDYLKYGEQEDNAAVIVITEHGFKFIQTQGDGLAPHRVGYAKAALELSENVEYINGVLKSSNTPQRKLILISKSLDKKVILARVTYGSFCSKTPYGSISFTNIPGTITSELYEQFIMFYEKYNELIKKEIEYLKRKDCSAKNIDISALPPNQWSFCVELDKKTTCYDSLDVIKEYIEERIEKEDINYHLKIYY